MRYRKATILFKKEEIKFFCILLGYVNNPTKFHDNQIKTSLWIKLLENAFFYRLIVLPPLNNSDLQIQEIKSLGDVTLNDQSQAMLTQKDENDNYYEQYTIYLLHEKKK